MKSKLITKIASPIGTCLFVSLFSFLPASGNEKDPLDAYKGDMLELMAGYSGGNLDPSEINELRIDIARKYHPLFREYVFNQNNEIQDRYFAASKLFIFSSILGQEEKDMPDLFRFSNEDDLSSEQVFRVKRAVFSHGLDALARNEKLRDNPKFASAMRDSMNSLQINRSRMKQRDEYVSFLQSIFSYSKIMKDDSLMIDSIERGLLVSRDNLKKDDRREKSADIGVFLYFAEKYIDLSKNQDPNFSEFQFVSNIIADKSLPSSSRAQFLEHMVGYLTFESKYDQVKFVERNLEVLSQTEESLPLLKWLARFYESRGDADRLDGVLKRVQRVERFSQQQKQLR